MTSPRLEPVSRLRRRRDVAEGELDQRIERVVVCCEGVSVLATRNYEREATCWSGEEKEEVAAIAEDSFFAVAE